MYERAKLVKLLEECIQDAKNITIYRDLQPSLITCLFNVRLEEAEATVVEVVVPEVVKAPVEPVKVEDKVEPEPPVKVEEKVEPETP